MVHKNSANVLCNISQCKNSVMSLMTNICMLDKLCSGISYNKLSVNESTIYIK